MMSAYMIVFADIHDRKRFIADYGVPTAKLIGEFGGEYLVRGPGVEALEGGLFEGTSAASSFKKRICSKKCRQQPTASPCLPMPGK